jgi:ribonuclease J
MADDRIKVIPLGGVGEIGKNMSVIEYRGRLVVVDAGLRFPGGDLPGIDLVLPDMEYLRERRDSIEAIIITHGHEDHLGALPWLIRTLGGESLPPVYSSPLTIEMARSKLDEHRLDTSILNRLATGDPIQAGPFELELIHLTHSIPDACAVAIGTEVGTILFTGDYKFDQTPVDGEPPDIARLARLGEEGVLLLCGDSTNADRPGWSPSESIVGPALERLFEDCAGRIIVTSFASNVHRVQQVVDAAAATDRRVALVGRSMRKNSKIAKSLGHMDIPEGMLIQPREVETHADHRVVIVSTGSQGEPLSALRRMAHSDHAQIELRAGDTIVFSATPVPGNERAVNETIDRLFQIGCRVITAADAPIHASGHGYSEELKLMLNLTRPRFFMPVHGDAKRLRLHGDLAEATGMDPDDIFIGENGRVLELGRDSATFTERIESGVVLVDGMDLGDPADAAVRDRRTIADEGLLVVVSAVSSRDGRTAVQSEVVLRGVPTGPNDEAVLDHIAQIASDVCEAASEQGEQDRDEIERRLHDAVASAVFDQLRRRPVVVAVLVEA